MWAREGKDQNYNPCSYFSFVISSLKKDFYGWTKLLNILNTLQRNIVLETLCSQMTFTQYFSTVAPPVRVSIAPIQSMPSRIFVLFGTWVHWGGRFRRCSANFAQFCTANQLKPVITVCNTWGESFVLLSFIKYVKNVFQRRIFWTQFRPCANRMSNCLHTHVVFQIRLSWNQTF